MGTLQQEQQRQQGLSLGLRLSLGLAFVAFILLGANDGTLGVLLPGISLHYNVNKATIGLCFFASALGYLISSFNNGLLIQKLGNRFSLMVGVGLFLLGAGCMSLMFPFGVTFGAFFCIGAGTAIIDAGLNSYVAVLPHNTKLLNYLHAFYGVGAWLGPALASSLLAIRWGWNNIYLLWVGLSLVILLGLGTIFKNPPVVRQEEETKAVSMLEALKLRVVWLSALFLCLYVGAEVSLGSWSYSFLTEERHGPTLISGWIVSGYWLGLTLGRVLLGLVAQRIGDKRLIEFCLAGVVVGLALLWLAPSQVLSASGLVLTGFCLGPIFPTTIALIATLVPGHLLPNSVGFIASLGSMGAALFPWLVGNLAQSLGLWSLLPCVILLTIGMFGVWISIQANSQRYGRDS